MPQNDKLSGIVVYTIHDNDKLRDTLRDLIKAKYTATYLDESTYGIPIQSENRQKVIDELRELCDKACTKNNSKYSGNDSVCLYYPTFYENSRVNRYIKQVYIKCPETINID